MDFIKKIAEQHRIEFFLPVSEPEIEVLNARRGDMENMGVKLLLNNKTIIDNCLDKLKTVQYLRQLDIRVPETVMLKDYDGSFGYPFIIKARKGCGSKRLWIVDNSDDLGYIKNKDDGSLIAQEYIGTDSEDYTTGIFSDGDSVDSISFRRKLGFGGVSVEAVLAEDPSLDKLSRHVGREMRLVGSINLQSRRVGNEFLPYEINPRLSSTLLFRKQFGFDDAVWWINTLRGEKYSFKKKYKSGRAVRCLAECYFDMIEIEK